MIFYGTRGTQVLAEQLDRTVCSNCGEQTLAVVVYSRYAHIYWIPLFPIGKAVGTECTNCKQAFVDKEIPAEYKEQVDMQKSRAKTPKWHFIGLLLIAVAIGLGFVGSKMNEDEMNAFIDAPQVGDIYEIEYGRKEYSTWKVISVASDTVFFAPNAYTVNKLSALDDGEFVDDAEFVDEESFGMTIADLKGMVVEGKLMDVNR